MKKSLIAAAGATLAVAAMPAVGVFAATSSSFTDTLQVTVEGGCTMQNSQDSTTPGTYTHSDRSFSATIAAGNVGYLNATNATTASTDQGTITITCNTSDSSKTYTVDVEVTGLTSGTGQSAVTIAGGTAVSGNTSAWAIKSNASGTTASNPFSNYATAEDTVFLTATANNSVTFNPSYQVYVAPNQAPGTYNGTAVYEVTLP